ncbi:MAG: helix-turn-helix domain-containing protein [Bacteroidales bacterium]|nr:helix-turn-helix domain-containing protein [Bacteroidales bacterium]
MLRSHAFIVLFLLLAPSIGFSFCSYQEEREYLLSDMNQALARTIEQQRSIEISPDTIQNYIGHLLIPELRERSYVYYAMEEGAPYDYLCSDSLVWTDGEERCRFQSYATLSPLTILMLSDQRWSLFFLSLSVMWLLFAMRYFGRRAEAVALSMGQVVLSSDGRFHTRQGDALHLTPMQEQLLKMFFLADRHALSKQEICDALWPKKPDASDTLYTLIKRIKPVLEPANLHIDSERGKEYVLRPGRE